VASLVWSDDALADVRDVYSYIAQESTAAANQLPDRLQASTGQLKMFPESGRTVPDREAASYREVFVGNHRVIYSFDRSRDEVIIAAVIHGRRQLPPLAHRD
jgi:toxin ParE1/3/4